MVKGDRQAWKAAYFEKAQRLLTQYEKIFVCDADNVTSKQFQDIRTGMRGHGDVLMGKNTMMKKAIKVHSFFLANFGRLGRYFLTFIFRMLLPKILRWKNFFH